MNKKILTIFSVAILSTLILPSFVLGAVIYERTPAGLEINNPVKFDISGVLDTYPLGQSWRISTTDDNWDSLYWGCFLTNDGIIEENLPLETYLYVDLRVYSNDTCFVPGQIATEELEANAENPIFEVVAPVLVGPIKAGFDEHVPGTAITSITAYIGDLFTSTGPFLWLFMGIPLAFLVIDKVIKLMKPEKVKVKK